MTTSEILASFAVAVARGEIEVTPLVEGSAVLLHVPSLRSRTVNPTAMRLLASVTSGAVAASALADALASEHGLDPTSARADVEAFAASLATLLAPGDAQPSG